MPYQGTYPANICWFLRRLEDVFSVTILRLPRRLEDVLEANKMFTGDIVSNKSKCVSNKSMFHKSISDKSKANPKCVT